MAAGHAANGFAALPPPGSGQAGLSILAAIVAIAVSAAPVASAGPSKEKLPQPAVIYNGHAGLGAKAKA